MIKKISLFIGLLVLLVSPIVSASLLGVVSEGDRSIKVIAACLDERGHLTDAKAEVSIYYSNFSVWINRQRMTRVSKGIYSYTINDVQEEGHHMVKTYCLFEEGEKESFDFLEIPRWVTLLTLTHEDVKPVQNESLDNIFHRIEVTKEYAEIVFSSSHRFSAEDKEFIAEAINDLSVMPSKVRSGEISIGDANSRLDFINARLREIMSGLSPIRIVEEKALLVDDLGSFILVLTIFGLLLLNLAIYELYKRRILYRK
jgi:hypothetical protein